MQSLADLDIRAVKQGDKPLEAVLAGRLVKAADQLDGEAIGDPLAVAYLQEQLGVSLVNLGFAARAVPLLEKSRATQAAALGPDHPDTLSCMNNLASAYREVGRTDDAVRLHEDCLLRVRATQGPDHPQTLYAMNALAASYQATGRLAEAVRLHEDCLRRRKVALGPDHPDILVSAGSLGVLLAETDRPAEAVPLLERAYAARAKQPVYAGAGPYLIAAYTAVGRPADAVRVADEVLAEGRAQVKPGSPELGGLLANFGKRLLTLDPAAAEPVLRECLAVRERLAPAAWTTANAKSLLGDALLRQGKPAEAEPLLVAGYEGLLADRKNIPPLPAAQANLPEAADRLVELYRALGKPDEVRKWRAERGKYPFVAPPPRPAK